MHEWRQLGIRDRRLEYIASLIIRFQKLVVEEMDSGSCGMVLIIGVVVLYFRTTAAILSS
jgi:hypothetical protein